MTGKIIQVLGPVIDVDFTDYLPEMEELLEADLNIDDSNKKIRLEVAAHLGGNHIRAISIDRCEGLMRGQVVRAMQYPKEEFDVLSKVRKNLLTIGEYTPYCVSDNCSKNPRTFFNGKQFTCASCGWESDFSVIFTDKYKLLISRKKKRQ